MLIRLYGSNCAIIWSVKLFLKPLYSTDVKLIVLQFLMSQQDAIEVNVSMKYH